MSGPLSSIMGGGAPVGSIIQAPYNLTDPAWLPCDGRKVLRATYPLLSACLPSVGVFTATSRTKSGAPTSSAIANNGTNWVVTGPIATVPMYYTPDGITYTAAGGIAASADVRSVLYDGTNFVAATATAAQCAYSTTGGTSWTTSASAVVRAPNSGLQTCMSWASSLGTVGRFCLAADSLAFFTSDDRGVTWAQQTHGLGGNAFHVCWTGTKFIATTSVASTIYTSPTGLSGTWTAQTMPFYTSPASALAGAIISDGSGKVLFVDSAYEKVYTSTDHGATWSARDFQDPVRGNVLGFSTAVPSYTNGRFFLCATGIGSLQGWTVVSSDLSSWVIISSLQGITATGTYSYKSGVYLANANATSTAAFTLTEDTSYMQLPLPMQAPGDNLNPRWNNFMPFIKVK